MGDKFETNLACKPLGAYPHARRVGNLLFLSGLGPRNRNSVEIPGVTQDGSGAIVSYDFAKQCHAVFNNVKIVLEEAGSSLAQVVDVTVFLTNMKDDFKEFNRIWAEYFSEIRPCRTTIEVTNLPTPIAVEFKVVATV